MLDQRSIDSILSDALAVPPAQRRALLAKVCGSDVDLRVKVEGLIAALERNPDFLASPTADSVPAEGRSGSSNAQGIGERDRESASVIGAQIGPYKLLEVVGEGGFGSVYLAEQCHPMRRQVALKILKLGMDTRQVIARFEAERQALALMDHPNIAKVLDAGATEAGRPYFVMELVPGAPITAYCDDERLTIRERLALFVDVCHAVQHAHTKGVIHRDLKPSNVLVALQEGRATPKVIDFGIAKAVQEPLTDQTLLTEARQLIGTPEYMSPEQAQLGGVDIDTRSDVYALGVLLYELLTGVTPFDRRQLRESSLDELRRIIREVEPARPSTRVSALGRIGKSRRKNAAASASDSGAHHLDTAVALVSSGAPALAGVAQRRKLEPSTLRRALHGDLDWIVMKCLEKDRSRRYETANGLAMDIGRHLAGEAVVAAPPSRGYRLRKLVRRRRGAFAASAAVAFALLLGTVGMGVGWASSIREAKLERERADELGQLTTFIRAVIQGIPFRPMGEGMRQEILDRRRRSLELRDLDPLTVAGEMQVFTAALDDVNLTNVAMAAIEANIVDRLEQKLDERFAERPYIRTQMLHLIAHTRRRVGAPERAVVAAADALDTVQANFPADRRLRLQAYQVYAMMLSANRRYAEAAEQYSRVIALIGEENPSIHFVRDLGVVLHEDERIDESIEWYLKGLEIARQMGDPGWELNVRLHLALAMGDAGRVDEAEAAYRTAPPFDEDDPDAPGREAWIAMHLGALLRDRGEYDEALPMLQIALEYFREERGEGAQPAMYSRHQLGLLHAARGELAEAHRLQADACRHVREGSDDGDRQRAVFIHLRHAQTLTRLGRFEEAERDLLDAQHLGETPGVLTWSSARARFAATLPRAFLDLYEAWETAEPSPDRRERLTEWRRRLAAVPVADGSISIRRGSRLY